MTIIQFIWVTWFLFSTIIAINMVLRLIRGINPFAEDEVNTINDYYATRIINTFLVFNFFYQIYFWLDYIGFWKEIMK